MLSIRLIRHALHALEAVLQKVLNQLGVITALEEEKSELIKDFSRSNKLVLNVVVTVK